LFRSDAGQASQSDRQVSFAQLSNVDIFGNAQCVFKLYTEIPHHAIHLGVADHRRFDKCLHIWLCRKKG